MSLHRRIILAWIGVGIACVYNLDELDRLGEAAAQAAAAAAERETAPAAGVAKRGEQLRALRADVAATERLARLPAARLVDQAELLKRLEGAAKAGGSRLLKLEVLDGRYGIVLEGGFHALRHVLGDLVARYPQVDFERLRFEAPAKPDAGRGLRLSVELRFAPLAAAAH